MYLGIDIGGSKTLLAVFSLSGELIHKVKFETPRSYQHLLPELRKALDSMPEKYDFKYCCCAAPGYIDRKHGIATRFGNLKWHNVPLKEDIGQLLGGVPVVIENDAKLAGLSEAIQLHGKYKKVLYLTIGTGIGDAIIIDGKIDPNLADSEVGQMVLDFGGELRRWEDVVSGRALFEKYGKKASEIDDQTIWQDYAYNLAKGMDALVSIIQPEVVIIGGGVGAHYEKFAKLLSEELEKFENEMIKMPPILKAKRPEEAVTYGCYEFIKQQS